MSPPTISSVAAQVILEDIATSSLPFRISDPETPFENLILSVTSSNPSLIPYANVVISSTGANGSLVITPAANQNGSAMITVMVSDGTLSASQTFQVTVQPVDDPATITLNSQPLVFHVKAKKVVAIDGAATITDIDTPTIVFTGSVLQVAGQGAKDTLSILKQGDISHKGKNVLFGKTVIGTVSGGTKGAPLTIRLNGAATQNSVQLLLRAISFKSTDKLPGNRMLHIQITNIGSTNTNQATKEIHVGL